MRNHKKGVIRYVLLHVHLFEYVHRKCILIQILVPLLQREDPVEDMRLLIENYTGEKNQKKFPFFGNNMRCSPERSIPIVTVYIPC